MATKTSVILIDDLDGSEAEESVKFSVDGVSYEIDLSGKNAQKLRNAFSQYVDSARRVGGRAARGRAPKAAARGGGGSRKPETAEIRAWAKDQGYEVSDRGRIPADVIEAYHGKGRR